MAFQCIALITLFMAQTALASVHTWTGVSSALWSDEANWSDSKPQPGEPSPVVVTIPSSAPAFATLTNDIPGLVLHTLTVAAHANILTAIPGVALTVADGAIYGDGNSTIIESAFNLNLSGDVYIHGSNSFIFRCPVSETSPNTTVFISGDVRVEAPLMNSGATVLTNGTCVLLGAVTNASHVLISRDSMLSLAADFTSLTNLGHLTIEPGSAERPDTSRIFARSLALEPGSTTVVSFIAYPALDSTDPADGSNIHSHVVVDGPVSIAGELQAESDLSDDGLRFTIIENISSNLTIGEFNNLPEGALFPIKFNSSLARISYQGGDGNDVTLIMVIPPVGLQVADVWRLGNGWLQLLGGIEEFDIFRLHQWQATSNPVDTNSWVPLTAPFIPVETGLGAVVTNTMPLQFFRLVAQ